MSAHKCKKGDENWINVSCGRFIVNIPSHCSYNLYKVRWPHAKKPKTNQKKINKKPPFVSKLYWAEPAVTLAMLLMFAPSFHKVLQRHHSGHPDSSFMQCYEMLIRSCFPKSRSTTLQRRGGEEEVGRKKERKKECKRTHWHFRSH